MNSSVENSLLSHSLKALTPPKKLTVSEWADQYRILSKESSAAPGKYKTSKTPYLKEIMDEINNYRTEIIVFMKSAQVGATECLINIMGYFISEDPGPILMIQPTLGMADTVSKQRITPLFRDTPILHDKISAKTRDKRSIFSQ
jgi:phage terminase large subunit GpA-like protein